MDIQQEISCKWQVYGLPGLKLFVIEWKGTDRKITSSPDIPRDLFWTQLLMETCTCVEFSLSFHLYVLEPLLCWMNKSSRCAFQYKLCHKAFLCCCFFKKKNTHLEKPLSQISCSEYNSTKLQEELHTPPVGL